MSQVTAAKKTVRPTWFSVQIHHCLTYSLSIMVVDETKNPWVAYVVPLFLFPTTGANELSVAALRWAMLALGATHLS